MLKVGHDSTAEIDLKENKRQKRQESVNGVVVDRVPRSAYEQRAEVKPTDGRAKR